MKHFESIQKSYHFMCRILVFDELGQMYKRVCAKLAQKSVWVETSILGLNITKYQKPPHIRKLFLERLKMFHE